MCKKIWRECTSKKRYKSEYSANHYRKIIQRERGVRLDYYWCQYCNGFHLTSKVSSIVPSALGDSASLLDIIDIHLKDIAS